MKGEYDYGLELDRQEIATPKAYWKGLFFAAVALLSGTIVILFVSKIL